MSHLPYFYLNDIVTAEVRDNCLDNCLVVSTSKNFFFPRRKDNLREKY